MYRMPGALEREAADIAALADHAETSSHDAYRQIRVPLWSALHALGFTGGDVLIQGDGAHTLIGSPDGPIVSIDFLATTMTKIVDGEDPRPHKAIKGGEGDYDLVISSLPWADVQTRDPARWSGRLHRHAAMTIACARLVRPGGLFAVLATHDLMDVANSTARQAVLTRAAFLGAVRLPAGALRPQAGTDNVVDLMLFARRPERGEALSRNFVPTVQVPLRGARLRINQHFDDHPDHMLGSIEAEANVWGPPVMTVQNPDRSRLGVELRDALTDITRAAITDGLVTPPEGSNGTGSVRWAVEGMRRYLPELLNVDSYRGRTPRPEAWNTPAFEPPSVDL